MVTNIEKEKKDRFQGFSGVHLYTIYIGIGNGVGVAVEMKVVCQFLWGTGLAFSPHSPPTPPPVRTDGLTDGATPTECRSVRASLQRRTLAEREARVKGGPEEDGRQGVEEVSERNTSRNSDERVARLRFRPKELRLRHRGECDRS